MNAIVVFLWRNRRKSIIKRFYRWAPLDTLIREESILFLNFPIYRFDCMKMPMPVHGIGMVYT